MSFVLIDEQPGFIVVSKEPGVAFHTTPTAPGLVQLVRESRPGQELFAVHRLDTITSGLLLFATSREAAREFGALFRRREIFKAYVALGDNHPVQKQGTIAGDMVNGRRGVWILSRTIKNPAVTQFVSAGLGNGLRLYLLRPLTGRTHQIRVALKALGAPVVGDPLYAASRYAEHAPDRAYLHAYALRFDFNGRTYSYCDKPRAGKFFSETAVEQVLEKLGAPWEYAWPRVNRTVMERIVEKTVRSLPAKSTRSKRDPR